MPNMMKEFFEKAREDEAIKAELRPILEGKTPQDLSPEDISKLVEIAKAHGFEVGASDELSDDALSQVAGGRDIFKEWGLESDGWEVWVKGQRPVYDDYIRSAQGVPSTETLIKW